ncbi:MAG TPA: hypothetical protein VF503_03385 [Sphingobium sp.]|uniref:PAS domain-containing protein n=1 Tax=Sphingobium sp. TaxID=1912891 RepID=UPI002ED07E98
MDGLGSQHQTVESEPYVAMEAPPMVRFDERRMHVRAYNYWASLLGSRSFPSIEDLNPEEIEDFGSHSVLIDFTSGIENPGIAFLGSALVRECGVDKAISRISDVPPRTLLSRLTDHCLQIIANQAPIGFEAEFTNQRGAEILYRGIMMPFSTDDEGIDFVYGVINWKEVASPDVTEDIQRAMNELAVELESAPSTGITMPIWADGPSSADFEAHGDSSDDMLELTERVAEPPAPLPATADAGDYLSDALCESLAEAQGAAADAISAEGRTRQALYRAIGLAHCFALLAKTQPADYAALLEDAEIVAQPRSPMTALVKLVFGTHYDKTRLSEFAVAIDHGLIEGVEPGKLADRLSRYDGGLKAYVRDARAAKRGPAAPRPSRIVEARKALGQAPAIAMEDIATDADGLAVIVVRRLADGSLAPLGGLSGDDKRVGQVLQAVAPKT